MNYFYDLPNELQEKIINHSKEFYCLESGQVFNLNKCYSYGCYDLLRIDKVIKQQQQKQTIYRVLGFVKMKKLPYETETRPKSHLWRPINFIAINIKSIDNKIKIVDRTAHLNNKIYYNYILIDKTALINNLDYETKLEIENHKNILKHLANYYYAVYNKKMNYYNNDFLKLPKF